MWGIIKWLFIIGIIGGAILWFTGIKLGGKTIQEHTKPVLESPMVKEGIKDVRQLVGEGLKAAGEAISEDITDSEKKQLDDLVKQEMMKGKPIEGVPGQQALPPAAQAYPQAQPVAPRPGAAQMLQQAAPPAPAAQAPLPPSAAPEPTQERPIMMPEEAPPQAAAPLPPQGGGY